MSDPILDHIARLERSDLNDTASQPIELAHFIGSQHFLHIIGLTDFWSHHPEIDFGQCMSDLAVSAHSQGNKFLTMILAGTPEQLSVYISLGDPETTVAFVEAVIPGVRWEWDERANRPKVYTDLAHQLPPHFYASGVLSGIPSRKNMQRSRKRQERQPEARGLIAMEKQAPGDGLHEGQGLAHLERVVRGMAGTMWAYMVRAYPRPQSIVLEERLQVIDALAEVSSQMRGQVQKNTQTGQSLTASKNTSYTETISGELINYRAQYLAQLLEYDLARWDETLAVGQWTVDVCYGAATSRDVLRLGSLLVGLLAGNDSRPEPVRAHSCELTYDARPPEAFKTYLTSSELALLLQFSREEVPGYAIYDFARFDVDFVAPATSALVLGTIVQQGKDTHETYRICLDDLTKHAVVIGVTGSGKTTTMLNLLHHCADAHMPFLVIEPVKTEYRVLQKVLSKSSDVRVYTLGNEMIAPFRLNPFEFETNDTPGSGSLLNHIDFLKAVFNAAFVLYAPMPYVLETALYEVYQDKGWDLATGKNTRLPDAEWPKRHLYPIFPTLTDLYHKVEIVTNRLQYFSEIEQNVKAGLKARLGSLRLGAKGFMLDTPRGIAFADLLKYPTVLELENIGNDDEKTFLMGLFLARLYEYRRLQASSGTLPTGLQHVLVFEEAHRLLKQTTTQVDNETANPRAQAIETFTNMLSEIRGYGQGVIVAEQIPSKLAPDVLKNTNLKIVHRLVAQDDRTSVGQTMNLNALQMLHLGTLAPGKAAVYGEGADHAYLVRMENYKAIHKLLPVSDMEVQKISHAYAAVHTYLSIQNLHTYGIRSTYFQSPEMTVYQNANIVLETEGCQRWWTSVVLCVLFQRHQLLPTLQKLPQLITARISNLSWNQLENVRTMVIVWGVFQLLHERGAGVGWTFPFIEDLRHHLTQGLLILTQTGDISLAHSDLEYVTRKYTMRMERKQGPFPACGHCPTKCLYRADVSRMLTKREVSSIDGRLAKALVSPPPRDFEPVAERVKDLAVQWLEGPSPLIPEMAFCIALHAMDRLDVHIREQNWAGEALARHLL